MKQRLKIHPSRGIRIGVLKSGFVSKFCFCANMFIGLPNACYTLFDRALIYQVIRYENIFSLYSICTYPRFRRRSSIAHEEEAYFMNENYILKFIFPQRILEMHTNLHTLVTGCSLCCNVSSLGLACGDFYVWKLIKRGLTFILNGISRQNTIRHHEDVGLFILSIRCNFHWAAMIWIRNDLQ